ncbi:MAG: hypothetical protein EA421_12430 [Gemmatimonadales bacterium]|jgi:hypothetical protein|nr:MAG: hypothetical protein EA421_12430 [Gemmatimonadales bacterium]
MTDRIHEYLDGEITEDALTPEERREAQEHLRVLERTVSLLGDMSAPDVTEDVMARISGGDAVSLGESAGKRPLVWLLEPRTVRVRPAYGLLAAAALLLVILFPPADRLGLDEGLHGNTDPAATSHLVQGAGTSEAVTIFVHFRLDAPTASEVRLAGSFTGWEPRYAMHPAGEGSWSVLVPLQPGVHDYAFVVDGREWVADPAAPAVDDGFGGENSRLALLLPNGERES